MKAGQHLDFVLTSDILLLMVKINNPQPVIFQQSKIRRHWDEKKELWYFSIIDIVGVLTNSNTPVRYWSDLKTKLMNEGSEVYDKIVKLKFTAIDGKNYPTDFFSTEDLFRVIQSIPSPKAEPFNILI